MAAGAHAATKNKHFLVAVLISFVINSVCSDFAVFLNPKAPASKRLKIIGTKNAVFSNL